jgi:hypothetical protein
MVNPRTVMGDHDQEYESNCVEHPSKDLFPKWARIIFYSVFVGVGVFNMGITFKELFSL